MKKFICAALLAGTTLAVAASSAQAGIGISLGFGDVNGAYSDGYYDGGHHWHNWRAGEWDRYRQGHPGHYSNWRHDDRRHGGHH
jgi:opacity protein-like surface antigen